MTVCRANSLRCECGVVEKNLHLLRNSGCRSLPHASGRIEITEGIDTVEIVIGAAIPEGAIQVDSVDHAGGIATCCLPHVNSTALKNCVRLRATGIHAAALNKSRIHAADNTGRTDYLRIVEDHRIDRWCLTGDVARQKWRLEAVSWKVGGSQLGVDTSKVGLSHRRSGNRLG